MDPDQFDAIYLKGMEAIQKRRFWSIAEGSVCSRLQAGNRPVPRVFPSRDDHPGRSRTSRRGDSGLPARRISHEDVRAQEVLERISLSADLVVRCLQRPQGAGGCVLRDKAQMATQRNGIARRGQSGESRGNPVESNPRASPAAP